MRTLTVIMLFALLRVIISILFKVSYPTDILLGIIVGIILLVSNSKTNNLMRSVVSWGAKI